MTDPKVLLLEANEIPYRVLDDYVRRHPQSALTSLCRDGRHFETVCEDQIELDPWISWPTLHRGVRDVEHRILHLGQDLSTADARYPPVWELLGRAGVSYGVFGSLHAVLHPEPSDACRFHVPDVFASSPLTYPAMLMPFQDFNLAMTRRSGRNVDRGVATAPLKKFAKQYLRQYANRSTINSALGVLASERIRPHLACRRRSIQPRLAYDVFEKTLLESMPSFATFHTNHVAAAMHRYWAAAYPDDISRNRMPKAWRQKYRNEIDYAMATLDAIVERLVAGPAANGYKIVLTTSLGQGGVSSEPSPGFRSIVDLEGFMSGLGLDRDQWTEGHAMVPNVSINLRPGLADVFEERLCSLTIGGHRPFLSHTEQAPCSYNRVGDSFQLYIYFEGLSTSVDVLIDGEARHEDALGIGFMPHQDGIACSGRHTPDGLMIVWQAGTPAQPGARSRISTLDIAPAILDEFSVERPDYMTAPPSGLLDVTRAEHVDTVQSAGGGVEATVTLV